MGRTVTGLLLGAISAGVLAQPQQSPDVWHTVEGDGQPQPVEAALATAPTTLQRIDALRPDLEPLDPFAPRPNRMAGRFRYDPSPEEITLRHNGYLMYYGTQGLAAGGRALNKLTGGRDQIQHAVARDVPLDEEQMARAARWTRPTP